MIYFPLFLRRRWSYRDSKDACGRGSQVAGRQNPSFEDGPHPLDGLEPGPAAFDAEVLVEQVLSGLAPIRPQL